MGSAKDELMRREGLHREAVAILVEAGALEECEYHPGTHFDSDEDQLVDAYKLANARMTAQGGVTAEKRLEFTNAIKAAYEDNSGNDGCESCRKVFGPED